MSYGDNSGGYGGGSAPSSSNGTIILVLGILGIICVPILAPVAWIMGNGATKSPSGDPQQANFANIGKILGIIGSVLMILYIIGYIGFGAAILGAAKNAPTQSIPSFLPF